MKFGAYTAILHDRPLREALAVLKQLGLDAAEINVGGFLPPVHMPDIDNIVESTTARDDYLTEFETAGVALAGLNVNGNPLHPDPSIGPPQAGDLRRAIRVAGALGQTRVVSMSGLPGGEAAARVANWNINPWNSEFLDVLDWQWEQAVPFWREIDALAGDHGVRVAIEMHPHNLVFNPATLQRLVEHTGATNIGAEMDPSHLFWQGIDPVAAVRHLDRLVAHAAAKDVRINDAMRIHGVLDDRFRRPPENERTEISGGHYLNMWPQDSAWDFVALGKGHDQDFWNNFVAALRDADPEMAVNIEHEDESLGQIEGLQTAADVLLQAAQSAGQR
jgi:sugar phosphate isomerase/epimerase